MSEFHLQESRAINLLSVSVAGIINLAIAGALLTIFSIIRKRKRHLYEPRVLFSSFSKRFDNVGANWIGNVWKFDELKEHGKIRLDCIVLIQFLSFCLKLFGFVSIWSALLMVLHYYGPNIDHLEPIGNRESLAKFSIENIKRGSLVFYVHAVLCWVYSLYAYYLLYKCWLRFAIVKQDHFKETSKILIGRTLLFTSLPETFLNSANLGKYVCEKSGIMPTNLVYGLDCPHLCKLIEQHSQSVVNLEKILFRSLKNPKVLPLKRPRHRVAKKLWCIDGHSVDAISDYKTKIDNLSQQIYTKRSLGAASLQKTCCCFVEFRNAFQCHQAYRYFKSLLLTTTNSPQVVLCPEFNDILWRKVGESPKEID